MHVFAAIVSFFSAFFLIRNKLALAKQVPKDVEQGASHAAGDQNARSSSHSPDADDGSKAACDIFVHTSHRRTCLIGSPRLVSSSRWQAVVCFAWSRLALRSAIFASGCMGVCLLTSLAAFF